MSEVTKQVAIELQVDGESAYAVESVPALVPIDTDDTGAVTDHTNKSITIYGRKGANARAAATITNYTLPTGFTFVSNSNGVLTFKAGSQATLATSANVEITATYDGLTFGMLIPLVPAKQGETGTDADDTEWIYKYDANGYAGTAGEVNPSGAASGNETNKQQKGWVPNGWYDHALAISASNTIVYASYRTLNGTTGQWGAFQTPIEWSHWGRNGQDGDGTEYVFIRTQNNVAPVMDSTQTGYATAKFRPTITSASQTASGTEQAQATDNPKGVNETYPFEWVAKRTMSNPDASGARAWTKYTGENNDYKMSLWSNLGQDGNGIVSVTRTYGISASGTTASDTTSPSDITTWSAGSPTVTTAKPYLWVKEITVYTEIPDTTKYYCVGKRGDNGVDAKDVEWVYIRTTTPTPPTILDDRTYTDSNTKTYTADGHLPRVDSTNRTDIEKENSGSSSKYYECTDDPKGVNDTWKYEWEIKRTKGNVGADGSTRAWNYYTGSMTLHNNYAESAFIIDIDNDNDQFGTDSDSKVLVEQVRTTKVTLYDGAAPQTLTGLTATLKYEDGTNVPTSVATKTTTVSTGVVSVTVKQNNTANTHTEIQAHIEATCEKGSRTIVFTLYKVMGGQPGLTPIIYQVAATNKVFSFQRTDANALTPSSRTSQINVARTEGNTTTILDTAQTGLTFSWGFDDDTTAQASSQSIGDTIEVTNTNAASHSSVWVELSTGDRETLSIVKDGAKGASITKTSEIYSYGVNESSTTPPSQDGNESQAAVLNKWYSTRAKVSSLWTENRYLWTKTYITWSDDSHTTLYSSERNPNDGIAGLSIVAGTTTIQYKLTETNVQPTSGWGNYPSTLTQGWYLWSKATTPYYKGQVGGASAGESVTYNVSYIAEDGASGRGLTSTSEHYNVSNSSSTQWDVPSSGTWANEWTIDPNVPDQQGNTQWDSDNRYLWNYEKLTYTESNGSTTIQRTTPRVIAIWTEDGKGIDSITNYYAINNSSSVAPVSGWNVDAMPPTPENPYLWNYEVIAWTDGTSTGDVNDAHVIGHYGRDGENSIRLALDNEHEDFLYSDSGIVSPSGGATSQARLYDGVTEKTSDVTEWRISDNNGSSWGTSTSTNATASINTSTNKGLLTVTDLTANSAKIKVRAKYNNKYYYAEFTANKASQDKYDLVLSDNAIAYNTSSSFSTKRIKVYADVTNLSGATSKATISAASGSGTIRLYATYGGSTVQITSTITESSITKHYLDVTQTIASANDGIYFELRKYSGSSYIVVDYETVEIAKVQNGGAGQSSFKSTIFTRTNETPIAPDSTYGSFAQPSPPNDSSWVVKKSGGTTISGVYWHDGIPSGDAQLWASTRIFTSDGASPQQSAWTTPRAMTDTADFDVEYSTVASSPGNPTDNPSNWGDTASTNTIWMATRDCHNGVWSDWQVSKIKGEKGDNGGTPENRYQWNQSPTSAPSYSESSQNPGSNWKTSVPTRPGDGYYLWAISAIKTGSTYGTWGNAIRLTGDTGTAGQDSAEREWIYKLSSTTSVTIPTTSTNTDGYVPDGWNNHPLGVDSENIYEYACYRDKPKGTGTRTWSAWKGITGGASGDAPILWSHWGRNGMDGDGVEYVFVRTKDNVNPAVPTQSQSSTYCEENNNYDTDEHLPYVRVSSSYDISGSTSAVTSGGYKYVKCTDDPVGADSTWKYEWVLKRSKGEPNSTTGVRAWEKYSGEMSLWANWGEDGTNGETPAFLFRWETSVDAPTVTAANYVAGTNLGGWSKSAPNKVDGKKLWMSQNILVLTGSTYSWKNSSAWSTPVCISGEDGDPGADAKYREWIYIRQTTYPFSGTAPASITKDTGGTTRSAEYIATHDDFVPQGWSDNALPATDSEKYVYTSWRDYDTSTEQWGAFQTPILWSNWGVQGMDGDGVQYIYKLFDHELTDAERTSNIPTKPSQQNSSGEWLPISGDSNWYDDPQAPTSSMKFCYCSIIKRINGTWGSYEKLGLWSKWSEDGTSPYIADLDNEMDSIVCGNDQKPIAEQVVTTNISLFCGTDEKTPSITSITRRYGSGSTRTWTSSSTSSYSGVKVQWTNGAITITYGTAAVITDKDTFTINVKDSVDTSVTRTLVLTVNGIKGDARYNLVPSDNVVSKSTSGTYSPSTITCAYTKYDVAKGAFISSPTGGTIVYTKDGGSTEYSYTIGTTTLTAGGSGDTGFSQSVTFLLKVGTVVVDRETVQVVEDGANGTSPYFADIDNEMDSVPCTYGGVTTASYDKYINVSLWHGSSPETTLTKLTTSTAPTNVTLTPDKTNKRIRVQVSSGVQLSERSDITITVASANSGDKTLHFILNGVRGGSEGTPATIFSLLPSTSSIKKDKSNTLVPASPMTCDVLKVTGNSTPTRATSSDGTLYYKVDGDITSTSTSGISQLVIGTGQVAYTPTNKYITFAFFKDTTMLDKERVPIVYDGTDGTSPIVVDLTNENDSMLYDSFGTLKSGNVTSEAKLYVGSQDKSADATWSVVSSKTNNVNDCTVSDATSRNITITAMAALKATVTVTATYPSGSSNTYTAILNLKKLINEDKYELEVTPNAIAYNSTTNLPPSQNVSVNIWKTSHTDGSRTKSAPPSGYNVRVYANGQDTSYYYAGNKSDWATNPYVFTITPSSWSSCIVALNNASNLSSGSILDSESIPINKAENGAAGTSPYIADLDNEMDSVACDKNGKVKASTICGTNVSLFYGSSKRSYKITGITKNGSSTMGTGVTVKIDDSTPSYPTSASQTHTVSVTYATTATISSKDDFAITLQDATDTSITRVLHFTINGVREGANGEPAIIFRLNPNVNEIVKKKNGTYIPAKTSKVTCTVLKTTGSETSEEPIDEIDDYVAKYKLNGTGSEAAFPINGITVSDITSKLEIFLYNADSSILLDKETIPLVEDGTDGTSPYLADLDNEMGGVVCDSDGYTTSEQYIETNAQLFKGTAAQTLKSSGGVVCSIAGYPLSSNYTSDPSPSSTYKAVISGLGTTSANIKVYAKANLLVENMDIKVTLTDTNNVSRDATLTMNGVRGGENAVLFNLLPSVSAIKKSSDDVLAPTSLTCDVRKITGNSTPTRATSSDGTLRYRVDGDITSTSDGTALTINTGTVNSYTATSTYITFAFFKGTTLVDKERVPIVYDGDDAGQMQTNIIRESHFNTLSYWATHEGEVVNNAIGDHKGFKITQSSTASFNSALTQYLANDSRQWLSPSTIYTLSFWLKSDASTSSVYTYLYDYVVDPSYLPYVDGVRRTSASSNYTQYGRQDWESTNGSWVYHTFTFKTNSTRSSYTWKLLFGIWGTGTATATICMPKLELGDKASGYMLAEEEMGESYRILYTWNSTTKIEVKDLPCNADYSGSFSGNFYFYLQRLVDGAWTDCANYYWAIRGFNSSEGINYGYNGASKLAGNNISASTVNSSNNRYFEVYFLTEAMTPAGVSTAAVTETTTRKIFMSSRISKVPAGVNGENAIHLSIDNEHEDFIYTQDGTAVAPSSVVINAHLWDGNTEIPTSSVSWTAAQASSSGIDYTKLTIGTGVYTLTGISGDTAKLVIQAEYPKTSGNFYQAVFTANKVMGDKYDLILKPSSIAYNPADYTSTSQVVSRITISAKGIDAQGNVLSPSIALNANAGTFRVFYAFVSAGGTVGQLTRLTTNLHKDISASDCESYVGIYFELRRYTSSSAQDSSSSYRLCDYETVEIAKAENGGTGPEGKGYKAIVYRNNFTEANWNSYGTIGHTESWSDTSASRGDCKTGDWFLVVGASTDTGDYHTLTYECTNDSGNLSGKCIQHQVTESGASISLTPSTLSINTNAQGQVPNAVSQSFSISVLKGEKKVAVSSYNVTHSSLPTGWTWTGNYYDVFTLSCPAGTVVDAPYTVTVTVSATNVSSITGTITILPNKKGDAARQPYEWGKWNDFIANNSNTFVANKYEAPYFIKEEEVTSNGAKKIRESKWLWVGSDGTFVPPSATPATGQSKSTAPSSDDSNWTLMVTDFKYLISEAQIADYGKFGAGIFSKDYAFSQYGLIDGGSSDHYKNFRPEFFKGQPYVMFEGSKTVSTTSYPSGTPFEFGKIFLDVGLTYTFTLTSDSNISSGKAHLKLVNADTGESFRDWYASGSSTTYTITRTETMTSSNGNKEYAIQVYSTSGSFNVTKIEISVNKAFKPNLYIDWLNGEIYSQLGRFVNVIVEGSINNLMTEINFSTGLNVYNKSTNPNGVAIKYDTNLKIGGTAIETVPRQNLYNPPSAIQDGEYTIDLLRCGNVIKITGASSQVIIYMPSRIYVGTSLRYVRPCTFYGGTEPQLMSIEDCRRLSGRSITFINTSSQNVQLVFASHVEDWSNDKEIVEGDNGVHVLSLTQNTMTTVTCRDQISRRVISSVAYFDEAIIWKWPNSMNMAEVESGW